MATLEDTKHKYLTKTKRKISDIGLTKSNANILPINTFLFSSRATIGEISISKIEVAKNQGYKNFICNPDLSDYECSYYSILKNEIENIKNLCSGMKYREINKTQFSNYKIPYLEPNEQKKIVKKLHSLENKIMELKEEMKKIENQKKEVLTKYL